MSVSGTCLASYDTGYSADSVEWLDPGSESESGSPLTELGIFVCGTYQLIDPTTKKYIVPGSSDPAPLEESPAEENCGEVNSGKALRTGNIQVFKASTESPFLEPIQTIETSASLDLKWSFKKLYSGSKRFNILGQVDAAGQLSLYSWDSSENKLSLQSQNKFNQIEGDNSEVLALSLDWSNRLYETDPFIAVSLSDGTLATMEVCAESNESIRCSTQQRWKGHDFEAWIAAVNYWNPITMFSGGDDAKLKCWDLRMVSETWAPPAWVNKSHLMGVCSIQANPHREHIIATGSYDETLRIFDTRKMKAPLKEVSVGGGIWRVRWHPSLHSSVLIAAMHGGFHVVDTDLDLPESCPEITKSFLDHQSLAYGVDWCPKAPQQNVASCSFYDHKLCLW